MAGVLQAEIGETCTTVIVTLDEEAGDQPGGHVHFEAFQCSKQCVKVSQGRAGRGGSEGGSSRQTSGVHRVGGCVQQGGGESKPPTSQNLRCISEGRFTGLPCCIASSPYLVSHLRISAPATRIAAPIKQDS
jgi:hypothetical protein